MKTLFKNAHVIDVFLERIIDADVLIEDDTIIGVGSYDTADKIVDLKGKYICPGFIDGHIHIESTMLKVDEFAKICLSHGTTSAVVDPHEIANVCGVDGIKYVLEASAGLPMMIYVMLPSCVPATGFDESFEEISATKLEELINHERVLGLAEMMNYVGVIYDDPIVLDKLKLAQKYNKIIDGHAPMLEGAGLDKYVRMGITSDHEASTMKEAIDRISRGEWLMIREGSAAKNLEALIGLFDSPYNNRCLLVTDDKEAGDLLNNGHIDSIIRKSVSLGKNPIVGIKMATINAAKCFKLDRVGAIAPSYKANILVLDDLNKIDVSDVYVDGIKVIENKKNITDIKSNVSKSLDKRVRACMNVGALKKDYLHIEPKSSKVRVMGVIPGEIITDNLVCELDFNKNNGISVENDILKIAVIERHNNTAHVGVGYIKGIGLKSGAIASTVSHDSHNIIVLGTNDDDMYKAVEEIIKIGGGNVIAENNKIIDELPLEIAGLMSDMPIEKLEEISTRVRRKVYDMGVNKNIAPFMNMAFVSLPVIPALKITTKGLVDVTKFELVDLFVD